MAKIICTAFILFVLTISQSLAGNFTLRIPLHASSISLDPSKVQDISSLWVSRQINCQLVRMNGGVPTFDAAESIYYINPLILDIKLKPNIYFTNGKEVTAEDVIASFDYLRKRRTVLRNIFSWIDGMSLKGKYELTIKLKKPTPQLLTVLSAPHYAIFEKNFINEVTKNSSLWSKPVGCGDYKLDENDSSFVNLSPIKDHGLPIKFSLIPDSQLLAKDIDNYDIISMQVIGKSDKLSKFNLINIFDPFQYYFVFNTRIAPWNNKNARCAFFSKLNPEIVINAYGDRARPADDLLPSGTLGYVKDTNYMGDIASQFKSTPLPQKKSMCISFVATSIEKDFRPAYVEMIKQLYPQAISSIMQNYTDLNNEIIKEKCDGTFYAEKSNYLEAYEYFVTFSEKGPSPTGYHDKVLAAKIQKSQDIDNPSLRAKEYHSIANIIKHECLMYPLFTMPYDIVYVRNNLEASNIGQGSVNEYSLANIKLKE